MRRKELFKLALIGALTTSLLPNGYMSNFSLKMPIFEGQDVFADPLDISDSITVYETLTNNKPIRVNNADSTNWIANLIFTKKPKANEYFTVKLPKEVSVNGDTNEKAKLPEFILNGKKLADLSYDKASNTLKYTFNSNVDDYEKVRYTLNMKAFIDREKAPNSGDVNLVYRVGDRPYVHEVKIDYEQNDGDNGIISNAPHRMNGSQNIIINNTEDNTFRYVAYVNPLYDNVDQIYTFKFTVNNKPEDDRKDGGFFTPDPESPYYLKRVRTYVLKPGQKLRDSFKYDYDGNPEELTLVDELVNDRAEGNTVSYDERHLAPIGNKPYIFVVDFAEKPGQNSEKVFASTLLTSRTNMQTEPISLQLESEAVLRDHNSDASLVNSYKIGDKVWLDENKDGILDGDESGVADVVVKLKNSEGRIINVTSTDDNGEYSFDNLTSGNYTVEFEVPENYEVTVGGHDSKGVSVPVKIDTKNDMTIDLGLNKVEAGTIDIQHIYYHLPDGQETPNEEDKPEYINRWKAQGYSDEKYRTYLQTLDDFKLIKVESSENVKSKPTMSHPETVNNYINGENQSIKFIYVKTGHVESEKYGKFIENHKYFETADGEYKADRDTNPKMQFSDTTEGKENQTFVSQKKERDGYTLVEVSNSDNVKKKQTKEGIEVTNNYIPEQNQEITYIYVKKAPEELAKEVINGSVDVVYKTTTGDILEDKSTVIDNKEIGTPYETSEKEFKGYKFVGMAKESDKASGTVSEGTKHVIYLYEPINEVAKSGKYIETHQYYITDDGNFDSSRDTRPVYSSEKTLVGTTNEKFASNEIPKEGYALVKVETKNMIDAPTKEAPEKESNYIADTTQEAHYIYVKAKNPEIVKRGSVDVIHKAVDGKVLKNLEVVKDNEVVGTPYETTKGTFDGYKFVGLDENSDKANGAVAEGTKHVIYLYEAVKPEEAEKKGSVDVVYKTVTGEELEPLKQVVTDEVVGSRYETTEKTFQGYKFVGMAKESDKAEGIVTEGTKHVIYLYEPVTDEVKSGNYVETHDYYITEDGNFDPQRDTTPAYTSSKSTSGTTKETFTSNEIPKEGFTLVKVAANNMTNVPTKEEPNKENNYIADTTQEAHYIYVKAKPSEVEKRGNVDVVYKTNTGEVLKPIEVVKNNEVVGTEYTTNQENFEGYRFVGMDPTSDKANGKVKEGETHVIYLYEPVVPNKPEEPVAEAKKGTVVVEYKTTTGVILEGPTDVLRDSNVGTEYSTDEKTFEGYKFVGMEKGSATNNGIVTEGEKKIVYLYEKISPTEDNSSQTEPSTPSTVDNGSQTEPSTPSTVDNGSQTEPSTPPTEDNGSQTEPSTPSTEDNGSQTEPSTPPTENNGSQTEPNTPPTEDNGSQTEPSTPPTEDNGSQTEPSTPPTVDNGSQTEVETPKAETPKAETPKAETPKVETPKAETPKSETPKAETPKAETPKVETPKAETPKAEEPKVKTPKEKNQTTPKTGDNSQTGIMFSLIGLVSSLSVLASRRKKKN